MTKTWAINALPVILHGRVGRLDLIEQLAPAIVVPEAVLAEIEAGVHKDPAAVAAGKWAARFRVSDTVLSSSIKNWNLGPGESQVINYCLEGTAWAVLGDQMARRCIRSHGLVMIGSLGLALRAKERGLIPAARPLVERLVAEGMFVNQTLLDRSLAAVGEPEDQRRGP